MRQSWLLVHVLSMGVLLLLVLFPDHPVWPDPFNIGWQSKCWLSAHHLELVASTRLPSVPFLRRVLFPLLALPSVVSRLSQLLIGAGVGLVGVISRLLPPQRGEGVHITLPFLSWWYHIQYSGSFLEVDFSLGSLTAGRRHSHLLRSSRGDISTLSICC